MIVKSGIITLFAVALLCGCSLSPSSEQEVNRTALTIAQPQLPLPITNNAVAVVDGKDGKTLYSFLGLGARKTHEDVSKFSFACPLNNNANRGCNKLGDVPVPQGRLASAAVTVNNAIYLFGGYTVAPDGSEVSTPEVLQFQHQTQRWSERAPMPTPVDDMVAFAHLDRYIYLVSGWHNDGNVSLTQVYDTKEDRWFRATDFPGQPVFGHSGGGANGTIIITDGVAVIGVKDGRRQFGLINDSWTGEIDETDPAIIRWQKIEPHPFGPLYRMASTGDEENEFIVFAGGGDNAYNYNGIGYDGVLTKPSNKIFAYNVAIEEWETLGTLEKPSMDHRGLLILGDRYVIVGGMEEGAIVSKSIVSFPRIKN